MATLAASPPSPTVGDAVSISGSGYTPAATVTINIATEGIESDLVADAGGQIGSTDPADHATTTLTITGQPVAAETITLDNKTYTWRASVATTANEVLIGGTAAASLQNLKDAVNGTGTPGTQYGSATVAHTTVYAHAITATTLKFSAVAGGTAGNSLASTETMTLGSFPGATFNSGTPGSASTGQRMFVWHPTKPGTFSVTATDGTNSGSCSVQVWR